MTNNKNYQKTQSRTVNKQRIGNVTVQSIKYLIMNPLDVNYILKQESHSIQD